MDENPIAKLACTFHHPSTVVDDLEANDDEKCRLVAGIDEAGRGPLAGSVVAAAVILDPSRSIDGLTDSKKLTEKRRILLESEIMQNAIAWAIGEASHQEIDEINILQASLLAMKRALLNLDLKPRQVLVDGNRLPAVDGYQMRAIVKGDLYEPCISAASILAKNHRDRQMIELDRRYPEYQFARHKGYPTALHREMLKQHGVCAVHRRSFKPVRDVLNG
ncbi:MAG: ribonuclease HII [Gammaproteobacteria bacterium]|nr:ribonuclease HII [Gammaproteobacteria bacterium]